jgi:adenylate cyclase class 2
MKEGAGPARLLIETHGYREVLPRTLQVDQVFDFPDRALRQSGRLIRVRSENVPEGNTSAILTYKGPTLAGGLHKSREELETSAGDARTLELILARLGLVPSFRYEKFRTTFRALEEPGVLALDETPIGVFIELEGPAYWIDATALRMGFKTRDYVVASYAALYRDFLATRQGSPDMLFQDHQRP